MLNIWGKYWSNKLVKIWCDNETVGHILTSGKTRDEVLALYARSIWLLLASNDIQTQYSHVRGVNNVYADRLSRWFSKDIEGDIKDILHAKTWYHALFLIIIYNFRKSIGCSLVVISY